MMKLVKFYGKVLNTWTHMVTYTTLRGNTFEEEEAPSQYEIAYRQYSMDGRRIAEGSEDFSPERRHDALKTYTVCTWDGEKRQSGGNRWFEERMRVTINRSDRKAAMEIIRKWFPEAALIQMR